MEEQIQVGPYIYVKKESELIGRGAFGEVYKCNHPQYPNLPLCIKIVQFIPNLRERQLREIQIMINLNQQLQLNQNLVRMHYFLIEDHQFSIVMERCEHSLKAQTFSPESALFIIQQIVNGYKTLSSYNIIHRDIKPENIFQTGNIFKIGDFGLARFLDCAPQMMSNSGSFGYAAPQILLHEGYTDKADIFSLGMTFYQLIYGNLPYSSKTLSQVQRGIIKIRQNPIKLWEYKRGLTQPIRKLIESMVRFHENDRIGWQELFQLPLMNQTVAFSQQVQPIMQMQTEDSQSTISNYIISTSTFNDETVQQLDSSTFISIDQYDPIQQIHELDFGNNEQSDQYYMAGILHQSAFILLTKNEQLKVQNPFEFYGIGLYLSRLSIRLLSAARLNKVERPFDGCFSLQQIEIQLNWQLLVLGQIENQIKEETPDQISYLIDLLKQLEQTQGIEFYRTKMSLFPYNQQQQYSVQYLQLLYILEKLNELTLNEFYNLDNQINQINSTMANIGEIQNYLNNKRNQ